MTRASSQPGHTHRCLHPRGLCTARSLLGKWSPLRLAYYGSAPNPWQTSSGPSRGPFEPTEDNHNQQVESFAHSCYQLESSSFSKELVIRCEFVTKSLQEWASFVGTCHPIDTHPSNTSSKRDAWFCRPLLRLWTVAVSIPFQCPTLVKLWSSQRDTRTRTCIEQVNYSLPKQT